MLHRYQSTIISSQTFCVVGVLRFRFLRPFHQISSWSTSVRASAPKKLFSILNVKKPVSSKPWGDHTSTIEEASNALLEEELQASAWEAKVTQRNLKQHGLGNLSDQELQQKVVDVGVTLDGSWSSRGWSASDGLVAAVDVDSGKVADVIHLSRYCTECKKMELKKDEDQISRMEFLEWFVKHEPTCKLNHEGSSAVSVIFSFTLVDSFVYICLCVKMFHFLAP